MTPPEGGSRPGRELAFAALFFLAYTVLATWPQAIHLPDAMTDLWDAKLSGWILHWDYVQTFRDPLNLFQAPILHPARYVLAFSENLYGAAVFGFPLLFGGASLVTNYNVLLLLGMFLSAVSAWTLARYVTGDPAASLLAGIVYAFLPYKISQLAHFHMEWGPFLCLTFLFLLKYLDGGRRRDAVLFGVFFAWNAIAVIQYAFFTAFLVAIVLVYETTAGGAESRRRMRGALLAIALATVAVLPFAIPYKKASDMYAMRRYMGEMTYFSAKPGYFLSAGERNRFWGPITARWRGQEGDLFPGVFPLILAGAAVVHLRRRPAAVPAAAGVGISPGRRGAAGVLDVGIVLLAGAWIAAAATPDLRLGPLRLGDPGRVQVILTLAVVARLCLAFPKRSRYASLADFLRRQRLEPRVLLLLAIAFAGVLIALGGNTPYYRFLFQSFGAVFRAVRVAARGIVISQAALAVLAAWGLSALTRGRRPAARRLAITAVILLVTVEYRAFPVAMMAYDASPVPVYEWLRASGAPGAVVEWPLGFPFDCEYTLRQAEHGQPLVNGHSSFVPKPYGDLNALVRRKPIPDAVWPAMTDLGAGLLVYHPHAVGLGEFMTYPPAVRRGWESGALEPVGVFPHGEGRDFVFRLGRAAAAPTVPEAAREAATRDALDAEHLRVSPPFGVIHLPAEGQRVAPGFWAHGWVLDDSGISAIQGEVAGAPPSPAEIGRPWPGLEKTFPEHIAAGNGGWGLLIPEGPPGETILRVRVTARDGGVTVLERSIDMAPATGR